MEQLVPISARKAVFVSADGHAFGSVLRSLAAAEPAQGKATAVFFWSGPFPIQTLAILAVRDRLEYGECEPQVALVHRPEELRRLEELDRMPFAP